MRLVIDIDDKTYADIKKGIIYSSIRDVPQESVVAIANGIPLPKGHGRLIDVDKLKPQITYFGISDTPVEVVKCSTIKNAPTIIKADKEIN